MPLNPGQCPSRGSPRHTSSSSSRRGSPAMTAGKSITSPNPTMPGSRRSSSMSFLPRWAPEVASELAGTHEGMVNMQSRGALQISCSMKRIPAMPITLAISWGFETMVVKPHRTAARANSRGRTRELSTCTWASMKPGQIYLPCRSTASKP